MSPEPQGTDSNTLRMLTQCVGTKGLGEGGKVGGKKRSERWRGRKEGGKGKEGKEKEEGREGGMDGVKEGGGKYSLGRWKLASSGYENKGRGKLQ